MLVAPRPVQPFSSDSALTPVVPEGDVGARGDSQYGNHLKTTLECYDGTADYTGEVMKIFAQGAMSMDELKQNNATRNSIPLIGNVTKADLSTTQSRSSPIDRDDVSTAGYFTVADDAR
jgi:hypothetical protein